MELNIWKHLRNIFKEGFTTKDNSDKSHGYGLSIVKELVENSIDAKSTIIRIELIDSGVKEIKVTDDGVGMDKDELSKMEQLFYTSKVKGCGVGVALSKEIIRLHNGELSYNSVVGEYTEAVIKLPILEM